jgi:hypothetical protein
VGVTPVDADCNAGSNGGSGYLVVAVLAEIFGSLIGSGSGNVGVTPVDGGDQRGSNGGSGNVAVAVLAEI